MSAIQTDIGAKPNATKVEHSPTALIPRSDVWEAIKYVYAWFAALVPSAGAAPKDAQYLVAAADGTLTAERVDWNPKMLMNRDMDHWRVTLRYGKSRMSLNFSMGFGLNGREPDVAGVLECLLSDSTACDQDFHEFCREFGYEEDSRTAERIYKACVRSGERLRAFLGQKYEEALYAER